MHRTRVKICGITRPQDALAAAEAGADAIGVVLHAKSKRLITTRQAQEIISVLPPFVTPVGLFVDHNPPAISRTARMLRLVFVQLHGGETPEMVAALRPLAIIKAVNLATLSHWRKKSPENLVGLLLDSPGGGSGVTNDWRAIGKHRHFLSTQRWIAAGGLTPANVAEVVRTLRPWAVDVSSGVESRPGVKSAKLIRAFIDEVRRADAEIDD